ncbi:MAG TPA: hypothetical protein VH417_01110 [Vicinamibacterales bacterium]
MDERARQSLDAIDRLLDRTTPWLSEIGSWIFGGVVAVDLVGISSLLTVGPVDAAVRLSITLFACALPMSVAGIVVLRLTRDLIAVGVDDLAQQAFRESGLPDIDAYFPTPRERPALLKRRAGLALRYALAIAAVSGALTLAALVAALWHMAWWIGGALLVMSVCSAGLVLVVFAHAENAENAEGAGNAEGAEAAGNAETHTEESPRPPRSPRPAVTQKE